MFVVTAANSIKDLQCTKSQVFTSEINGRPPTEDNVCLSNQAGDAIKTTESSVKEDVGCVTSSSSLRVSLHLARARITLFTAEGPKEDDEGFKATAFRIADVQRLKSYLKSRTY